MKQYNILGTVDIINEDQIIKRDIKMQEAIEYHEWLKEQIRKYKESLQNEK